MPVKFTLCFGFSTSSVLFADGVSGVSGTPWNAVAQLGLSIVLAVISFMLLVWWTKKNIEKDQKESERNAEKLTELEKYVHVSLVKLIVDSNEMHLRSCDAISKSTEQITKMGEYMDKLNTSLNGRLCLAIESMSPEQRKQVYDWVKQNRE